MIGMFSYAMGMIIDAGSVMLRLAHNDHDQLANTRFRTPKYTIM